jgi:uncharacterized protein involved in oxidation of intracellular sulfur
MKVLLIFNRVPYDDTDVTWSGLRLAGRLMDAGHEARIFLMNDAVDLARDACTPPPGYDQDLAKRLRDLIARGAKVKTCVTCLARCGILRDQPCNEGVESAAMQDLAHWVVDSNRVISF